MLGNPLASNMRPPAIAPMIMTGVRGELSERVVNLLDIARFVVAGQDVFTMDNALRVESTIKVPDLHFPRYPRLKVISLNPVNR